MCVPLRLLPAPEAYFQISLPPLNTFSTHAHESWYFTQYSSSADKKVFFVDYKSQADLIIYFTSYQSSAGWKSSSKKYLLQ